VADVLAEQGHDVTVLDLEASSRHRSVRADLLDADALTRAFTGAEFICHLAAVGDVYLAAERPGLAAQVNVVGTANVCEAALRAGAGRVVYASTWEVYGTPQYQPIDELHPCTPDHPYNITKLAGERLAVSYAHMKDLDLTCLRLGTAYGTRMRPNSVFSIFIRRALAKEPITIQGTGDQGRQFTHARDIGEAFGLALGRSGSGEAYNTVADDMVSIRRLAEMVVARIPTELTFAPARKADVPSATVSNAKIKTALGWMPKVRFADGLEELISSHSD
jgi:UDP-glucose 4-epimerase